MGMNAYSAFSSDVESERSAEKLLEHIDRIIELYGAGHVGLGLDLCDCITALRIDHALLQNGDLFSDHADAKERFFNLIREKYPDDISDKIFGENFMRVLEEVIG